MTSTPAILWETFGLTGLASAVAWGCAIVFLVAAIGRRHRWRRLVAATVAAAAGVVLAGATSTSIRAIEVDRSAEVLAAEAAGTQAVQEKFRGRAANVRFAEDTAADQADVAGVTVAEEEGAYERAVAEQLEKMPAYRRGGRKERSAKKPAKDEASETAADADANGEDAKPAAEGGPAASDASEQNVRKLPESELIVADRFDSINRGLTWSVFAVAVGLVSCEWLRRFNTTFDAVWPLPLAGTVIDGATTKAHVVAAPAGLRLADFLPLAAAKGESFVVFAADDPLAGRDRLARLAIDQVPAQWRLPLPWSLPVRSYTAAELVADPTLGETVFESAWFGRGGFIVLDGPESAAVLTSFADALDRRRHCRAAARRTLNLVWALPTAPDADVAGRLERLAAATNVRWIPGAWT